MPAAALHHLRELPWQSQALRARRIRQLGREPLAALGTTTSDNTTATDGRHAGTEAVLAAAAQTLRLIGSFHRNVRGEKGAQV